MPNQSVNIHWFGDQVFESIKSATDDAWWDALAVIESAAVANAPRDRGELIRSAYRATSKRSNYAKTRRFQKAEVKPGPGEGAVGFSVSYAHFLELGTSKMAARPYLRPAFDQNKDSVVDILAGNIRDEIGG